MSDYRKRKIRRSKNSNSLGSATIIFILGGFLGIIGGLFLQSLWQNRSPTIEAALSQPLDYQSQNDFPTPNSLSTSLGQQLPLEPTNPLWHQVQEGQTLTEISQLYNIPLLNLQQQNDLDSDYLTKGQQILVQPVYPKVLLSSTHSSLAEDSTTSITITRNRTDGLGLITIIDNLPPDSSSFTLSPQGRYLAYLSQNTLWVETLDPDNPRRFSLTELTDLSSPPLDIMGINWAPDEKHLLLLTSQDIILQAVEYNFQEHLASSWYHQDSKQASTSVSWSPDSQSFIYLQSGNASNKKIQRYDLSTKKTQQLREIVMVNVTQVIWPHHATLYLAGQVYRQSPIELYRLTLSKTTPLEKITDSDRPKQSIHFLPDTTDIIYHSTQGNQDSLWWQSTAYNQEKKLATLPKPIQKMSFEQDAIIIQLGNQETYWYDFAQEVLQELNFLQGNLIDIL